MLTTPTNDSVISSCLYVKNRFPLLHPWISWRFKRTHYSYPFILSTRIYCRSQPFFNQNKEISWHYYLLKFSIKRTFYSFPLFVLKFIPLSCTLFSNTNNNTSIQYTFIIIQSVTYTSHSLNFIDSRCFVYFIADITVSSPPSPINPLKAIPSILSGENPSFNLDSGLTTLSLLNYFWTRFL